MWPRGPPSSIRPHLLRPLARVQPPRSVSAPSGSACDPHAVSRDGARCLGWGRMAAWPREAERQERGVETSEDPQSPVKEDGMEGLGALPVRFPRPGLLLILPVPQMRPREGGGLPTVVLPQLGETKSLSLPKGKFCCPADSPGSAHRAVSLSDLGERPGQHPVPLFAPECCLRQGTDLCFPTNASTREMGKVQSETGRSPWAQLATAAGRQHSRQASSAGPFASFAGLLLLGSALVLLSHLSLARNLPVASPGLGMLQCLNYSQNLLRAVSSTLHKVSYLALRSVRPPAPQPLCPGVSPKPSWKEAGKLWEFIAIWEGDGVHK